MKKLVSLILTAAIALGITACGSKSDDKTVTVAATSAPHAEVLEQCKPLLK